MPATEPIRNKEQLKALANFFLTKNQIRNYTLVILTTHTALRISDVLDVKWTDVYSEQEKTFYSYVTLIERKTKKHKIIRLNKEAAHALQLCYAQKRNRYIFASNRGDQPITRQQARRIIRKGVEAV